MNNSHAKPKPEAKKDKPKLTKAEAAAKARANRTKDQMGGRPPKLILDARTLKTIEGLGKIQTTNIEAAAVLGVSRETFEKFLGKNKSAEEAFERGKGSGKISLRRAQFALAEKGNASMLIWLGKQYLGQRDKFETDNTGNINHIHRIENVIVDPNHSDSIGPDHLIREATTALH
jgi:hypothetical protein